jgi:general secretion pathway protein F
MGDGAIRLSRAQEVRLVETVAALTASGLTAQDAYAAAAEVLHQTPAGRFAAAVAVQIEQGASPAAASSATAGRLSPMHTAMLAVAEETGAYATTLSRAASHLRARAELREKTIGSAIYPAFVLLLTVAGALILITLVFPAAGRFMSATGMLSEEQISGILTDGILSLGLFVGLILAGLLLVGAAALSDKVRLRLPVTGRIELYSELLAFSQAIAGMQSAGIPTERAFAGSTVCVKNRFLASRLAEAAKQIGAGVSQASAVTRALPQARVISRWFALGEHGADPGAAAEGLILFLETELSRRSQRLGSLLEPIFVILAGLMIVLVVVTLIQPLFGLYAEVLP